MDDLKKSNQKNLKLSDVIVLAIDSNYKQIIFLLNKKNIKQTENKS